MVTAVPLKLKLRMDARQCYVVELRDDGKAWIEP